MIGLLLLTLGLAGQWLLGVALADLLLNGFAGRERSDRTCGDSIAPSFTERAGLGFVLGIGATSGIQFLWSLCGGSLGRELSFAITAVGAVSGGLVVRRELMRVRAAIVPQLSLQQESAFAQERAWCRCCQWLIAGLFLSAFVQIMMTPQHLWDERATFALKGIVLWEDRTVQSRDLADPDFVQGHPLYPLLIPLAEEHVYALWGGVDDRLSKVIFPLLYLGMALTLVGRLSRHLSAGSAWLFALLLATIPALMPWEYGFLCGQADAPTACYHGVSALYLWDTWKRISSENPSGWFGTALLAGLCGALAAFTKDEGISYLLVDAIAVTLVLPLSRRPLLSLRVSLTVFGFAALLLLPWFLHRRGLPLTSENNYFGRVSLHMILEKQAVLQWEIPHLASRMFWEFRTWGLQWWLLLFAIVAAPRRALASPQLILLLDVIGSVLCLMLAGMLSATEVSEHVGLSSHRYLMQIAPIAVLFSAGQLGSRSTRT